MATKLKIRDLPGWTLEIEPDVDNGFVKQVQVRAIVDDWIVWREWDPLRSHWNYEIGRIAWLNLLILENRLRVVGKIKEVR